MGYLHLILRYNIIKIVRKQHWHLAWVCDSLKRYRSWSSVLWLHSRLDTWGGTLNTPYKWPGGHMEWRQYKYLCPYIFCTVFPSAASAVSPEGPRLEERKQERSKCVCSYFNHFVLSSQPQYFNTINLVWHTGFTVPCSCELAASLSGVLLRQSSISSSRVE